MKRLRKEDYTVGWICALPVPELKASRLLFDEEHEDVAIVSQHQYVYGNINQHNVVAGCLPATQMGIGAAAAVASEMASLFSLRFCLMVGVGGGVPSSSYDIRLGDVVVGKPDPVRRHGGVIQYDFGKTLQDGELQPTGMLNQPPYVVLSALSKVMSSPQSSSKFYNYLDSYGYSDEGRAFLIRPKIDRLFKAQYPHPPGETTCERCDWSREVERRARNHERPVVHYGTIASGNQVMKDAATRDKISQRHGDVLCFEMEAAGLLNQMPCVVIRGICDYSDTHKNKDWQSFAAAAAAAWAKELLRNIAPVQPLVTQGPKPSSTVPFPRDEKFVGRQEVLASIDSSISHPECHNRIALTGLGGIGKSQIAIEYSYRYRARHPNHWVFWVHASTTARFLQAYQEIARRVEAPNHEDPKADVLQIVKDWLDEPRNGSWLLIIDNADDSNVFFSSEWGDMDRASQPLHTYIPQSPHGAVLITSRNDTGADVAGGFEYVLPVGQFDIDTATRLLRTKLPSASREDAHELVELLDRIPLGISQAAAYISQTRIAVSRYLAEFKKSEIDQMTLLDKSWRNVRADHEVPNTVLTSWRVSFEQIKRTSALAAGILSLLSMYDRQGIPYALIVQEDRPALEYDESIALLLQYSLIFREESGATYSMHRLVQIATRTWLEANQELAFWELQALAVLCKKFPNGEPETWPVCEKMLPHADRILGHDARLDARPGVVGLLDRVARYHSQRGKFRNAESMLSRALAESMARAGPTHPQTLTAMNTLAIVYWQRSQLTAAEALYQRVLQGREEQLGSNHLETLVTMNNLAIVYSQQERFADAEALYYRVLKGYMGQLGSDNTQTLTTGNNLAYVYMRQRRYAEAEKLYKRVLHRMEARLGPQHHYTLGATHGLAVVYDDQSRYSEAGVLFERVFEGREAQLGPEHPDTLRALISLAIGYRNQGRSSEAEPLNRRALKGCEAVLGPDHPDTLRAADGLARCCQNEGKYDEAETLFERVLRGFREQRGPQHPTTLRTERLLFEVRSLALHSDSQAPLA